MYGVGGGRGGDEERSAETRDALPSRSKLRRTFPEDVLLLVRGVSVGLVVVWKSSGTAPDPALVGSSISSPPSKSLSASPGVMNFISLPGPGVIKTAFPPPVLPGVFPNIALSFSFLSVFGVPQIELMFHLFAKYPVPGVFIAGVGAETKKSDAEVKLVIR